MFTEIDNVFNYLNYKPSDEMYKESMFFFSDMRSDVRDALEKLSWNELPSVQLKAISFLKNSLKHSEYIYLVLPDRYTKIEKDHKLLFVKHRSDKSRWENAAKLIVELGWPKTDEIIVPLFMWLLDNNWPGSNIIYSFLLSLPQKQLIAKMDKIVSNPQNYASCDYQELVEIIQEMKTGMKTD